MERSLHLSASTRIAFVLVVGVLCWHLARTYLESHWLYLATPLYLAAATLLVARAIAGSVRDYRELSQLRAIALGIVLVPLTAAGSRLLMREGMLGLVAIAAIGLSYIVPWLVAIAGTLWLARRA